MALIVCHECRGNVSDTAKLCPHCGAKVKPIKKSMATTHKIFLILIGLFFVSVIARIPSMSSPRVSIPPVSKPNQSAANLKRDAQLQLAGIVASDLKKSMKDPEAFSLTSAVVKDNGVTCYDYRAKNGFGAIFPGSAIFTSKGKLLIQERDGNAFVAAWNKECTASGGDDIAPLMKRMGLI